MSVTVNISITPSIAELNRRFGRVNVIKFLGVQIKRIAFRIEGEAKKVTPVDTGRLRASIRVAPSVKVLEATIQPHTNYATYVHEGTRYMRARPFMTWGAEASVKDIESDLADQLEVFIGKQIR